MNRSAVAVLAVVALVVFAGCGGVPDGAASPTGRPSATPTPAPPTANGTLAVHFVNVGQSTSTLVVGPTGETMLIDTGDWRDDGEDVLAYLRGVGVDRVDYLVASHGDADHIGGNAAVIEYFETEADGIGAVYDQGLASTSRTYERYLDAVERHDVALYRTQAGDEIPLAGARVRVLAPPEGYLANEERNENSVVLKLTFGETSFLLTGDAEDDGERYLLDTYGTGLGATVLAAGHHGSKSSTSAALLAAVDPAAVVVSSAYDSQYGHPHRETLERLAERSVPTYWTATHGTVVMHSTGDRITVKTQRDAPTAPLQIRAADPIDPGAEAPLSVRTTIDATGESPPGTVAATVPEREGQLEVTTIHADAAGDDRANLVDEYVVLTNTGDGALDLGGYTVSDASGATYTFPAGVVLDPGESVTLRTGAGTDTTADRYWDAGRPVWNNDGDTVTVRASDGTIVVQEAY